MRVKLPIQNFPKQQSIFDHPARYKIVAKGRRFGLTRGAANDYISCALNRTFTKGLWVDTVNTNIDRYVERYFAPALQKLPKDIWLWRKQAKVMQILDSIIDFRSADRPENIEGFGYEKAFLNEAGIILRNEYLWHNAIRPMMWDFKPQVVIGGTPKGRGIFYELALRGKDSQQNEYTFLHFTSFNNPFINKEVIHEDMKSMPDRVIKQEIYAEFMEDEGVVFRGTNIIATAKPAKPVDGHLYVMGVDLAKVQDFTVITVYDRKNNYQVYQDRFKTIEWPFQKKKIITVSRHYNNALVVIDASGLGDPIADDLIRQNVPVDPVKLTNQNKKELIEKLAVWTEQKYHRILPIPESILEFNSFTYDITTAGNIRYNAPAGMHDDIVIAHALAIYSLQPLYEKKKKKEPTLIQRKLAKDRFRAKYGSEYIEI